ncbi:hypothetical protein TNIN_3031 [Trichonephila inaurata madagascariensis]|uniref:Uncharacterized protein n=1 Tax=Trichonephila inaurata madagascariensis TaxID=2747483 RepID=A0A8X6YM47_9ARAC|nr:hypothetical protein TNIN_3031 [Trichonephila inaurata madagascariensis]
MAGEHQHPHDHESGSIFDDAAGLADGVASGLTGHYARVISGASGLVGTTIGTPYKIHITPVYNYKAEFFYGGTASLKLKAVTTLHLAFAPLEELLQDSVPTGLPLQGRVTAWNNCVSLMLSTVTLRFTQPQESSPRLGQHPHDHESGSIFDDAAGLADGVASGLTGGILR